MFDEELIARADALAERAHQGQRRKFGDRPPYIQHPRRLAVRLRDVPGTTTAMVIAALLHDVLEDTTITAAELQAEGMPAKAIQLVHELTNPSIEHQQLPRKERKDMDREANQAMSREARVIRLLDRTDNLRELHADDVPPKFIALYLQESKALLNALRGTNPELETDFEAALNELAQRIA